MKSHGELKVLQTIIRTWKARQAGHTVTAERRKPAWRFTRGSSEALTISRKNRHAGKVLSMRHKSEEALSIIGMPRRHDIGDTGEHLPAAERTTFYRWIPEIRDTDTCCFMEDERRDLEYREILIYSA